jgi:ParB family transcriptional regulator, chromosome partitioning protein
MLNSIDNTALIDDGASQIFREVAHMKIDQIRICKRYRRDLGDIGPLARSISDVGLLQSILVNSQSELIAGARRLRAVQSLGWEDI